MQPSFWPARPISGSARSHWPGARRESDGLPLWLAQLAVVERRAAKQSRTARTLGLDVVDPVQSIFLVCSSGVVGPFAVLTVIAGRGARDACVGCLSGAVVWRQAASASARRTIALAISLNANAVASVCARCTLYVSVRVLACVFQLLCVPAVRSGLARNAQAKQDEKHGASSRAPAAGGVLVVVCLIGSCYALFIQRDNAKFGVPHHPRCDWAARLLKEPQKAYVACPPEHSSLLPLPPARSDDV